MTFSGIAAIQAHIQAIEAQVSALGTPGAGTTSESASKTGADFASLLTDAMSTQAGLQGSALGGGSAAAGLPGSTADASGGGLSSLLGEASALTGSGTSSALGTASPDSSSIASLLSSLTGAGTTTGSSTTPDNSSLLSSLTGSATTADAPGVITQRFLDAALSQQGKPYVWGSSASASDASPPSFDCSELTKWAAARAGVTIPDGAAHQYVWLKEQGATMTVQQALQTPGALLFHFAAEPQPGLGGEPPVAHVAISLGNGMTMEAKGHAYGVGIFQAGDRVNYAGMIPGMK